MIEIDIHEKSCRGCRICVELCPTDVFAFDEETKLAKVEKLDHCIECLSCQYACPSNAIDQQNYHAVKNFYWDLKFIKKVRSFL